nr:hypothetical transcript [Hymenolepis microstoma]
MKADQMRLLALDTINAKYPAGQWLQVFTDESYVENQANFGAGVYSELFIFFAAAGQNRSVFEGEIETIKIAFGQLCCQDTRFTNAVVLSNSQSAMQSIETGNHPKQLRSTKAKNSNEGADTHAKKGTTISRAIDRPIPSYPMKTLIRREFNTLRSNEFKARTKEKQWTAALSNIANWPRLEAVAEFRLRAGHDCLAKHLHKIGGTLQTATEIQRYWEARSQLKG